MTLMFNRSVGLDLTAELKVLHQLRRTGHVDNPERVPVHLRAGDCQGLEAVDSAPRQEHEAAADEGDPHDAPAHLRLRRLQDILSGGESVTCDTFSNLSGRTSKGFSRSQPCQSDPWALGFRAMRISHADQLLAYVFTICLCFIAMAIQGCVPWANPPPSPF